VPDDSLISLVAQLRNETETLGVRGVRVASSEQVNWFRHTRDRLTEMGAEFLAQKLSRLIDSIDADDSLGAGRLLDLLTTIRVFDRVLTLQTAESALIHMGDSSGDTA